MHQFVASVLGLERCPEFRSPALLIFETETRHRAGFHHDDP
jgi:hypothetical protein